MAETSHSGGTPIGERVKAAAEALSGGERGWRPKGGRGSRAWPPRREGLALIVESVLGLGPRGLGRSAASDPLDHDASAGTGLTLASVAETAAVTVGTGVL